MESRKSFVTCDRCRAEASGEFVVERGREVVKYPRGWVLREKFGSTFRFDLCPECAAEYKKLINEWWVRRKGAAS